MNKKIRVKYLNCFCPINIYLKDNDLEHAKNYVSQHVDHYNKILNGKIYSSAKELAEINKIRNIEELYLYMIKTETFNPEENEIELINYNERTQGELK